MPKLLWADTPMSLISETGFEERSDIPPGHFAITCAQNMAKLHNTIMRCFNASYNQCLAVEPDTVDASDFLFYNRALYEHIHAHHDTEEKVSFPDLVKLTGVKDIMDKNIQEHKDFEAALDKFREYVYETDAKSYNGKRLQEVMDDLAPVLHKHLVGEIPTLLDLAKYDSKKLEAWWGQTATKAAGGVDLFRWEDNGADSFAWLASVYRDAPVALGCNDVTFPVDGDLRSYPPIPSFVKYISKYILERRYAGSWRFNPCDGFGKPRPLAFPNPT
ncbi:hypothetical protein AJ79_01494 [Helicocarpus griseus UAMH5409]|uniref:Hemerythrin-like domain-containing protein n=1 Tax=Helicocarpus griseus UAMH5409 TaxID=1447875 RepID=A0A2B7Y6L5_9EURO|nr:hypothetical protein AJ79_01494 [Helicocarpus griseus UAMH5409]